VTKKEEKKLVWHPRVYTATIGKVAVINPCPECGGKLILNVKTGTCTCQKCGKKVDPTEVVE